MQNILIKLIGYYILCLTVVQCSCQPNSNNLDTWLGNYNFEENPVKATAGYFMVMNWNLLISKKEMNYKGTLEINGQQTYIKLLTDIKGDSGTIAIIYNSTVDGLKENWNVGDTLFVLSKNTVGIKTKWFGLEPRLIENPLQECKCFVQIGNDNRK